MSKLFLLKIWKPVTLATVGVAIAVGTRNWEKLDKSLHISNKSDEELRKLFGGIDKDGNGFIDINELGEMLKSQGITMSKVSLRSLMYAADENHDGKISFEEFLHICHKLQHHEGQVPTHAPVPKVVHAPRETHTEMDSVPDTKRIPLIKPLPDSVGQFPKSKDA